jgi:hypothetical protein
MAREFKAGKGRKAKEVANLEEEQGTVRKCTFSVLSRLGSNA